MTKKAKSNVDTCYISPNWRGVGGTLSYALPQPYDSCFGLLRPHQHGVTDTAETVQ